MDIDDLLQSFKYFGVELGLERIQELLSRLGNPHQKFPIIHVAGTNGKGSVCAYLSSILTKAGYRVGRYTSPHLVDWTERICLNQEPISTHTLGTILEQVKAAIPKNCSDPPTLFEVTTAAAWLYFAQQQVDLAVIEVGLGGRLDATNVCDRVLVSIITSLSWEHWQRLGPTLADIAKEKAGILKPGCPAVIGPLPPEARAVVESRVNQLGCPVVWVDSAVELPEGKGKMLSTGKHLRWVEYGGISYSLPLLGEVQLVNSAIAIATVQVLQQQGWKIPEDAIALGIAKTTWLGRLQWTSWENHQLLIDGAHNQASAQALRQYVDTLGKSVNWVMGILSTKDHAGIFNTLLRPGDRLSLVPVPDHSSAELDYLATLAQQICPTLADCATYPELVTGLRATLRWDPRPRAIPRGLGKPTYNKAEPDERITVLCGSLYLVGHFLRTQAFVGGNGNS